MVEVLELRERGKGHGGKGEEGEDVGLLVWSPWGGSGGEGRRGEGEGLENPLDPVGAEIVEADSDLGLKG